MSRPPVPVIAVNGFLESGKTFFLCDAIDQETFIESEARCLLFVCEEGNTDYDPRVLKRNHITKIVLEDESQLTEAFWEEQIAKYRPDLIYMEENVMWDPAAFAIPSCAYLAQQLTVINAESFLVYFNNMRQKSVDMLQNSEVVIMFNCDDEPAVTTLKRNLQLINGKLGFLFFNSRGDSISLACDLPYKVDGDYITVEDDDFGTFYVDSYENPERYDGKTCEVTVKAVLDKSIPEGFFVGGRRVMTCCAQDIQFLGLVCRNTTSVKIDNGEWLRLVGTVSYKNVGGELHALLTVAGVKKLPNHSDEPISIN